MKKTRHSLGVGLCLLLQWAGLAQAAASDAETVVRELTHDIYRVLSEQCQTIQERPEYLYVLVDAILLSHADLGKMSQWILGKHWRDAKELQRGEFEQQFRQLLVRTYSTAIQTVAPENIHYLPVRGAGRPDRALVRTEIRQPGEAVIAIDYPMYRTQQRWLVYDVRVEGVSLVTNYRTTFAEEIRDKGLAGLIAELKLRNDEPLTAEAAARIRKLQVESCKRQAR